ncbi:PQQ-binding-like beta-propeller repeat protein [Actinoplanes sp. DH11]|uniref:outer membrane protein assembly factor BamB family protein n=1 Tax=Actinoplanes sp. DH11 TaxID=2857011 RepID=UPI001E49564B|nr:PQQ-binding-like beta-propeller repeat protein [Actinoplanes sp. DH11]
MNVIELGELSASDEPEPDEPGTEFGPRTLRRLVVAAVVLLCAFGLGAAAPPGAHPPLVRDLWSAPMTAQDTMTLRSDGLFVFRNSGTGEVELTAYEPASGAVRWVREYSGNVNWMYQGEEAGLLLIPGDEKYADIEFEDGSNGQIGYGGSTTAIDVWTGRQLWKMTGEVQAVAAASVLLAERDSAGDYVSVRLVDARTGAQIWRHPAGRALHVIVKNEGPAPALIVMARADGRIAVLRWSDGVLLRDRRLPWSAPDPQAGVDTYLSTAGDLLLVSRNNPGRTLLTAYRTATLDKVWEIETYAYPYVQDCGPVLCLVDSSALQGLDPRTGRPVWTRPGDSGGATVAGEHLITSDGTEPPAQRLVDPATGAQIGSGGTGWPLRQEPYAGSLILLHRVYGKEMRDAVDHLNLTTGEVTRVGLLAAPAERMEGSQCDSAGPHLVCQRTGTLVVTNVG